MLHITFLDFVYAIHYISRFCLCYMYILKKVLPMNESLGLGLSTLVHRGRHVPDCFVDLHCIQSHRQKPSICFYDVSNIYISKSCYIIPLNTDTVCPTKHDSW